MLLNDGSTVNCLLKEDEANAEEKKVESAVSPAKSNEMFASLIFPNFLPQQQLSVSPSSSMKLNQDSSMSSSVSQNILSPSSDQASTSGHSGNYPGLSGMMEALKGPNPLMKVINLTSTIPEVVSYEASRKNQLEQNESGSSTLNDCTTNQSSVHDDSTRKPAHSVLYPRLLEEDSMDIEDGDFRHQDNATEGKGSSALHANNFTIDNCTKTSSTNDNITSNPGNDNTSNNLLVSNASSNVHTSCTNDSIKQHSEIYDNPVSCLPSSSTIVTKAEQPERSAFPRSSNATQFGIPAPPRRKRNACPPKPPLRSAHSIDKQRRRNTDGRNLIRQRTMSTQSEDSTSPETSYSEIYPPVPARKDLIETNSLRDVGNRDSKTTSGVQSTNILNHEITSKRDDYKEQDTNNFPVNHEAKKFNQPHKDHNELGHLKYNDRDGIASNQSPTVSNIPNSFMNRVSVADSIPVPPRRMNSGLPNDAYAGHPLDNSGNNPTQPSTAPQEPVPQAGKRSQRPLRRSSAVVPPPPPPRLSKTMSEN